MTHASLFQSQVGVFFASRNIISGQQCFGRRLDQRDTGNFIKRISHLSQSCLQFVSAKEATGRSWRNVAITTFLLATFGSPRSKFIDPGP